MVKILKVTLSIFILSLIFNLTSVDAINQVATNHVDLPKLSGVRTVAGKHYKNDSSKLQYFMTAQCTNNSTGNDELVSVATVRGSFPYDSSAFIEVPKHQRVPLSNKHQLENEYIINAKVVNKINDTVKFYGIWEIN